MEKKKIFAIVGSVIAALPILIIIGWWLCMILFMPTKYVNYTFNVDKQKITYDYNGVTGTYEKYFWEVNIHKNFYEVVINSIWDETEKEFKSYCIQFISNSNSLDFTADYSTVGTKTIGSKREKDPGRGLLVWKEYITKYRNIYKGNADYRNLSVYTYVGSSVGNEMQWQEDSTILNKMLEDDFKFLIQIGSGEETELFGLSPLNNNAEFSTTSEFYINSKNYQTNNKSDFEGDLKVGLGDTAFYYDYNYYSCDILYILERIYDYCSGMQNGTDGGRKLIFGDYFQYYSRNGTTYTKLNKGDRVWGKVNETVQSAFAAYVKVDDKISSSAHDSLINYYKGVENFGVTSENTFDYATSSNIYEVTDKDFVFEDGVLSICENFKNAFGSAAGKFRLNVNIDFSNPKFLGYETISINTDVFFVHKINGVEINQKLNNYILEVD